jgi:hypothetical protein
MPSPPVSHDWKQKNGSPFVVPQQVHGSHPLSHNVVVQCLYPLGSFMWLPVAILCNFSIAIIQATQSYTIHFTTVSYSWDIWYRQSGNICSISSSVSLNLKTKLVETENFRAQAAWLGSSKHRANLLNFKLKELKYTTPNSLHVLEP